MDTNTAEQEEKVLTFMVVEDEDLLLQAIGKKLITEGVHSILCSGGQEALDRLKSVEKIPDAVWLDYHLKDMDGLAFMVQLNKNPLWKNIPVVVVSNTAGEDKIQAMLALGAKGYMLKAEYRLKEIIEEVKKIVNNTHSS